MKIHRLYFMSDITTDTDDDLDGCSNSLCPFHFSISHFLLFALGFIFRLLYRAFHRFYGPLLFSIMLYDDAIANAKEPRGIFTYYTVILVSCFHPVLPAMPPSTPFHLPLRSPGHTLALFSPSTLPPLPSAISPGEIHMRMFCRRRR